MKKVFLILAFAIVLIIALLYGISPSWFASTFLGINDLSLNFAHILRAVMCLYLALGCFWLFSAFNAKHRDTAILTTIFFAGGLVTGRRRELHRRWSTRAAVDPLCSDGVCTRAHRLLDLHESRLIRQRLQPPCKLVVPDQIE